MVFWLRLGDPSACQSPKGVYVCHFLGQMLGYAYNICSYCQNIISCTSPSGSLWWPSRVWPWPSVLICCIHLFCDLWFHFYDRIAYICYLVASYIFSLWYNWFLQRCFVLLLGEILCLGPFGSMWSFLWSSIRVRVLFEKNLFISSATLTWMEVDFFFLISLLFIVPSQSLHRQRSFLLLYYYYYHYYFVLFHINHYLGITLLSFFIIIVITYSFRVFFISVLADGFSLDFEWQ